MKSFPEGFLLQNANALTEENIPVFLDVTNIEGYIFILGVKDKLYDICQFICFPCGVFLNQVL